MDERDGADVEAAGRLVGQQQAGPGSRAGPAGAFGCCRRRAGRPVARDPRSGRRKRGSARGHGPRPARAGPGPRAAACGCGSSRAPGSARSTGPPPPRRPAGPREFARRPREGRRVDLRPARAGRGSGPRRLSAGSSRPGDPPARAARCPRRPRCRRSHAHGRRDRRRPSRGRHPRRRRLAQLEHRCPRLLRVASRQADRAADHGLGDRRRAGPLHGELGHLAPGAKHRHPPAQPHHLVELVADEDDDQPRPTSPSKVWNSRSASCGVSTAVGSSRTSTRASR